MCTCAQGANLRSSNATIRTDTQNNNLTARQTTNRSKSVINRSATARIPTTNKHTASRTAVKTISARSGNTKTISARTATPKRAVRTASVANVSTKTFSNNYTTCRDAYFTCMDQFCANQNTTYRRCVCSSRLQKIQEQERSLSQTATSLQDFKDINIDAISKTAEEVIAMQTASDGETGIKKDKSNSAQKLNNIRDVLTKTKQNSLSTQGTLDIAGDIKAVWQTTDLIRGYDISTLSGEDLYNAVNAQCYETVKGQCIASDLKMVASAYGMYIENDCEAVAATINTNTINANAAIRTTRHEMQDARLENYNAHNSLSINDCIANVRQDITTDTACGENYVHCLDFTGKYLDITTGKPIYSQNFYQFVNQISLSGDILKNSKNTAVINLLNKKQKFAQQTLDVCRDVADNVWDEFLRQALVEISQAQQKRVQDVKNDCLKVVNECYLHKSEDLQAYADNASEISARNTLELSEQLCTEKLNTCSNLYGGGPEGLELLVSTMTGITDANIAQSCSDILSEYIKKKCAVAASDTEHSWPYSCRSFAPGEIRYANNPKCNKETINPFEQYDILTSYTTNITYNVLPPWTYDNSPRHYLSCHMGYYLENNNCKVCNPDDYCPGGTAKAIKQADNPLYAQCGINYIGSIYHMLVRQALQNCIRSTQTMDTVLPATIMSDVESTMATLRSSLSNELSKECDKFNGIWVPTAWQDNNYDGRHDVTNDTLLISFYTETGTNKLWGYCKPK